MKLNDRKIFHLTLSLCIIMFALMASTAGAMSFGDGAVQDGVTANWKQPTDFVCIVGVHADGTVDVADGVTSARDCIYLQTGTMNGGTAFDLTAMNTSAKCTTTGLAGNDGAKHSWATTFCTKSLTGLDRTQKMCEGIGGTWITTGKCVAYVRQFKGQDANGTPRAFGTKGTDSGVVTDMGFCYAAMNMTSAGYTSSTCPMSDNNAHPNSGFTSSAAYDWAWGSSKCSYSKGIKGYLNAALTKTDGTTYAAGTYLDMSAFTTMGACLANGGSWNNWVGKAAGTTTINTTPLTSTIPAWNYMKQAPDADNGCLHCHSTTVEYNGPAERFKDSYIQTGHKNMLRKVTAGKKWFGPDGVAYTTDGTHTIDFINAAIDGMTQNLYYLYGDWMVPEPTLIYGTNGFGNAPGSTNGYSCAACHTTGYNDNSNIGVQGIGTPGYAGAEPQQSFPGISLDAANPKWDQDGIQCSRCHNAAVGKVADTQIAASNFPSTQPTSGGMGALANTNEARTNLCYGCHQAVAKVWPAGTTNTTDPTVIPTGINHGASPGRDFNGHVLGGSFLNSPHARYTGTISKNSLGKYDLQGLSGGGGNYNSAFKGYSCYQSSSSSSPAKTQADGSEIKTKAVCETLYGAGAWRADNGVSTGTQGTCATCHDVHNSLFVADQAEKAIRKNCVDCHSDTDYSSLVPSTPQVNPSAIAHPTGDNTPLDAAVWGDDSCAVCHMALQAVRSGTQSFAAHLWRINTDPTYDTFPTAAEFNGTAPAVKNRNAKTAPDGAYTNAVWVDLEMACGQCHGADGFAHLMSKTGLQTYAENMHSGGPAPTTDCATCHATAQGSANAIIGGLVPGKNHHGAFVGCTDCHSRGGVAPTPDNTFCLSCHDVAPGVNHHVGNCIDCHQPGDTTGANGVTGPGVIPVIFNCNACHTSKQQVLISHPNKPSLGTPDCSGCHSAGGFRPTALVCNGCHGGSDGPGAVSGFAPFLSASKLQKILQVGMHRNAAPAAHMTVDVSGLTATVHDSSSDVDGNIVTIVIDWGDKSRTSISAGDSASHTYAKKGKKTITLTVTDSRGVRSTTKKSVTVS